MKHSEEHNHLSDEQHKGQEECASINVVAITRFTLETYHYQRINASMTDCNAKSCYNKITPELLVLLYAKAGCPLQIIELLYSALTQLEYVMLIALGLSEAKVTNNLYHLLFGIGQGATDGLPGWTFHTNLLTSLYNSCAGGSIMTNPTNTMMLCRNVDMIVDNATLICTNIIDTDPNLLQVQTHCNLSIWGK
eukprot:11408258-Ditylum_brightwellii.AAC.1